MEIDTYISRALDDHLNNQTNYKEVFEMDAHMINKINYQWICERFIDYREPGTVTDKEMLFSSYHSAGSVMMTI